MQHVRIATGSVGFGVRSGWCGAAVRQRSGEARRRDATRRLVRADAWAEHARQLQSTPRTAARMHHTAPAARARRENKNDGRANVSRCETLRRHTRRSCLSKQRSQAHASESTLGEVGKRTKRTWC